MISFIRSLYYCSWTSGGHRELAEVVLEDAYPHVLTDCHIREESVRGHGGLCACLHTPNFSSAI